MSKIYHKDVKYNILKPIVNHHIKRSYRDVEVKGLENIPNDGAVLICANHCSTLMDALVILRAIPGPVSFGARADIFKNDFLSKLLTFIKILPMVRQRDGIRNVLKNYDTIDEISEIIYNKVPFVMFPEGRHRPMHSLLPMNKGIVRIAYNFLEKYGKEMPLYIVPTGLEYGDYFRYGSTSLVNFGQPINITEFVEENKDVSEAHQSDKLRLLIYDKISELITFIPDDEDYIAKWTITKIKTLNTRTRSLEEKLQLNRKTVDEIHKALEEKPKETRELFKKAQEFEEERVEERISIYSFKDTIIDKKCGLKTFISLVLLPVFVWSAIMSLPSWGLTELVRSKVKDRAFKNTVNTVMKIVMTPLLVIIWAILAFTLLSPINAIVVFALTLPSYNLFYAIGDFYRILGSDYRLLKEKDLIKDFKEIKNWKL